MQVLGFKFERSGLRVLGFVVSRLGLRVFTFRLVAVEFRIWGSGWWVEGYDILECAYVYTWRPVAGSKG